MTQALFTVPTTGKYLDSVDGGKYRYTAGQVIPLDWAVRLQMPGASLPAAGPPFSDAQVDYLQDEFEPEGNFAASDHTHDRAEGPNLIANGDFETNIDDWLGQNGDETLTHETVIPLRGTGSLKVETTAAFASSGVVVPDTGWIPVEAGTNLRLRFRIHGDAPSLVLTMYWHQAPPDNVWAATLFPESVMFYTIDGILVPEGVTEVNISLSTITAQAKTFYLDSVYLGTSP